MPVEAAADTSTDLLLHETLTRRGLAAEAMRLMTWGGVGDSIRDLLMEEIREDAPSPAHQKVTLEQAVRADEFIWTQLAKLAGQSGGIRPRPDGAYPLDLLLPQVGQNIWRWRCSAGGVFGRGAARCGQARGRASGPSEPEAHVRGVARLPAMAGGTA